MLVRVKRLVFSPVGEGMNQSAEALGLIYVVRPAFCGGWEWWLCLKTECKPAASLADAIVACQVDFDRRWRESTEVPELVWEKCTRPNGSYFLRCNQSGAKYRVGEDSIGVYASIDDGGKSDITDLRIPKTEADAIAACNAHNRAAVLGE